MGRLFPLAAALLMALWLPTLTYASDRQAWFGDLHVHSDWSTDGYIFGNTNTPRDAYRFARGEAVPIAGGMAQQQLAVPLDFAAVTDHVETFAYYQRCVGNTASPVYGSDTCRGIRERNLELYFRGFRNLAANPPRHMPDICADNDACQSDVRDAWREMQAIAGEFNRPGEFTTFVGYEYTGNLADGGMLHRNVIFANQQVPDRALGAFDLPSARELWQWLDQACTGACDVVTIPHNSNLAWGQTFALQNIDGSDWTETDQRRRARFDRLVEIHQAKGNSECRTGVGTTDEFCNFEPLLRPCENGQETRCVSYHSFVRNGLKTGLELATSLGFNPYQYGIIGSTDTHNGNPGATVEDDYKGHSGSREATPRGRLEGGHRKADGRGAVHYNPGGLAGVWAEENTRDSLFAGFKRRETFGTSGNRTRIRLFGGWNLPADLHQRADAAALAYANGVPMGADLPPAPAGQAPRIYAWAARDPNAGTLQRLQVVKAWLGPDGKPQERTFDVACANDASPDPGTHRCPETAPSVNPATCKTLDTGGAQQLGATWQDPDFDPAQPAFYYARVLEQPTCRWSTYDLIQLGEDAAPAGIPRVIQERAWSSPVWYQPATGNAS